jgi:hypothetical protein
MEIDNRQGQWERREKDLLPIERKPKEKYDSIEKNKKNGGRCGE